MHSTKSEYSLLYRKIIMSVNSFLRNANIISYKESFIEEVTSTLCIVMDFADGGDLQSKKNSYKKKG